MLTVRTGTSCFGGRWKVSKISAKYIKNKPRRPHIGKVPTISAACKPEIYKSSSFITRGIQRKNQNINTNIFIKTEIRKLMKNFIGRR